MCCVSVRWWLTKPISTLFHVNMEFFGILSHITNIDWETTAHETRKKCYKRRKTIRQLFIFVIWNSSFKKRFQRAVFVVFFCSTHEKKKKIVWNKRNVKLYQMAQSVFSFSLSWFTHTWCASAFPCASKQHVIIMPFGKCSNENEKLQSRKPFNCVSVVRALTITHARKISCFFHTKLNINSS